MKNIRFLTFVLILGTLVLSACGAAAAATSDATASGKVEAMPVAFIGIVDSMAGDQWVISGTTVTVDPAAIQEGPFAVGDQVKVEGIVNTDGSFTVTRVESPTPQDVSTLSTFGNDNTNDANINDSNANTNDANINDDNSNDGNINDDNSNDDNSNDSNINDDNGNDDNSNDSNSSDDSSGNSNDDSSNSSSDNGDDSGGGSGKGGKGGDDGGGKGRGGGDDNGGDDNGSGGGGSDD